MPDAFISSTASPGPGVGSSKVIVSTLRSPRNTTPRIAPSLAAVRGNGRPRAAAGASAGAGDGVRQRALPRRRSALPLDRLPEVLASPEAVLLDTDGAGRTLLFAFRPVEREAGKVAVRIDFREGRRPLANAVRSAGYVRRSNLRDPRYVVLDGALDE